MMSSPRVIDELAELFRKANGLRPDTSRWVEPIDRLLAKGLTPQQIIGAAKYGMANPFHKPALLDNGPRYIEWKFNQLIAIGGDRQPGNADFVKFEQGRHQRWEVDFHKYLASEPAHKMTTTQWLERYMNANKQGAYDMLPCSVCLAEIEQGIERRTIEHEDDELWEDVA